MTPSTQEEIWFRAGRIIRPKDPVVRDGNVIWAEEYDGKAPRAPGPDDLLDRYCRLAIATHEEIAEFVALNGLPEVGGFVMLGEEKAPDWRQRFPDEPGRVPADRIREHARGVAAARRVGAALAGRRPGDQADWLDMHRFLNPGKRRLASRPGWLGQELGDWSLERDRFAGLVSDFLASTGVYTGVNWSDYKRLAIVPVSSTFLGAIALLLSREIGAEGRYACSSCGSPVDRRRPPRAGESVYCDRPECKREQQRRNQAAWRAKKAAERGGS
ncbi:MULTISPECIES: hypothetical protein [unclassified Nocardioides]|uniref:hypothetical protein n=1 Tax=unclassified Nocardioides TaxID=2615069 RepID=UPI000056FF9F|nr:MULTISPECIES: hypothetical protein [unclassified Nocardioides]ABL80104.1 hypothetical protein Noca_0562 [Nocardioides sp. JS614]